MAGLAGLLGGYGSEDEGSEDEQQQEQGTGLAGILGAPSGSVSPQAAAAASQPAATDAAAPTDQPDAQQQQQQPMRILDGPTTNPEPPPEGLSPPMARDIDSTMDSEAGEGTLHPALYTLPSELRDPPPGDPAPELQKELDRFLGWVRTGRSVMHAIRKDRRWQNPKFLQKSVEYFDLEQYGTCLSPDVWDPSAVSDEDRWPALQQQLEARKRRRGAEVKFQSAGQQLPPAGPTAAAAAAAAAMSSQPGAAAAGGAPKLVNIDARAAAAQALASTLVAGAKKSKWDK